MQDLDQKRGQLKEGSSSHLHRTPNGVGGGKKPPYGTHGVIGVKGVHKGGGVSIHGNLQKVRRESLRDMTMPRGSTKKKETQRGGGGENRRLSHRAVLMLGSPVKVA